MVRVRVLVSVRVRVRVEGRVFICPSEPSRERVKVSHVIVECRVINHHPYLEPAIHFPNMGLSFQFLVLWSFVSDTMK